MARPDHSCEEDLRGSRPDRGRKRRVIGIALEVRLTALGFVGGVLLAVVANPIRFFLFASHGASARLDFADDRRQTESLNLGLPAGPSPRELAGVREAYGRYSKLLRETDCRGLGSFLQSYR